MVPEKPPDHEEEPVFLAAKVFSVFSREPGEILDELTGFISYIDQLEEQYHQKADEEVC
ncbi:MAG: hypothetical protein R6V72_21560 [Cyclobacterium sp.]|uniref:hypothetical protein n=1 Tax=Cyclobacterium sp. TaxID=1966343 RepID=UPI0039705D83